MTKVYLSRKRTVITDRKKFFRFIILSALLINFIIFGLIAPMNTNADMEHNPILVTVRCGDTLWSIAEDYCPEGEDIRSFIYEIKKENSLKNSALDIGQQLLIPQ